MYTLVFYTLLTEISVNERRQNARMADEPRTVLYDP